MIQTFIITLLVFGLVMIGLAVGILTGRRRTITGCASANTPGNESQECGVCGRPVDSGGCSGDTRQSENGINRV